MKKKVLLLAMIAILLLPVFLINVSATEGTQADKTYEVVLLIDVSGSMNQADPNRVSIEAAQSFANNVPDGVDYCKISVILYNTDVITVLNRVDVTQESEAKKYQQCLDTIKSLGKNGVYNEFVCWAKNTDIGSAIVEAKQIISASTASKKTVLLFTDGKIDLDERPAVDTPDEILSETNSYESAEYFSSVGVPMYTIGLNKNNSVDKQYLQKLADMTDGEFWTCTTLDDLNGLFRYFTANFFEVKPQDSQVIPVQPDVVSEAQFNIYGQAIYEANFNLFCLAKIKTYQIISPEGTIVAERKEDGSEVVSDGCKVDGNESRVDVKLLDPADGVWTLRFSSKSKGTLQVDSILFYDLGIVGIDALQVTAGDTVELEPKLYNIDGDFTITTKEIYEEAICTVTVTGNGYNEEYIADVNNEKNGYSLSLPFMTPGEYQVTYFVDHTQFEVKGTGTVTVVAPELVLSANKTTVNRGETVEVSLQLKNSTNSQVIEVPDYLKNSDISAVITLNGELVEEIDVDASKMSFSFTPTQIGSYTASVTMKSESMTVESAQALTVAVENPTIALSVDKDQFDIADGKISVVLKFLDAAGNPLAEYPQFMKDYSVIFAANGKASEAVKLSDLAEGGFAYSYKPGKAGEHTVSVVVEGNGEKMEATVKFTVKASAITMEDDGLPSIKETTLGGTVKKEIELDEIFSDSDGDELTYKVKIDNDDISAEIDDGVLILTIKGGTEGSVSVVVSDGKGAEYTASFDVEVNSLLPLLIAIMIVIVLIGVSIPLILIFLKKRQTVRMTYRVKLSINGEYAVYDIGRASTNRRAKPIMTLKEIMELSTLATYSEGTLSEEAAEDLIRTYCGQISITGYAFKDGVRITLPGGKEKVFNKYAIDIPLISGDEESMDDISVAFGKATDFRDDVLY